MAKEGPGEAPKPSGGSGCGCCATLFAGIMVFPLLACLGVVLGAIMLIQSDPDEPSTASAGVVDCDPDAELPDPPSDSNASVDNPGNVDGYPNKKVTAQTAYVHDVVLACFDELLWKNANNEPERHCQRDAGASGDHPKGRACDFMMQAGNNEADDEYEANGNQIAQWLQDNADDLQISYLIWWDKIWSATRSDDAERTSVDEWRDYERDNGDPNTRHMNHIHVSIQGDDLY